MYPFGFTPPVDQSFYASVLTLWRNHKTGQVFVAPTMGWSPPSNDWKIDYGTRNAFSDEF